MIKIRNHTIRCIKCHEVFWKEYGPKLFEEIPESDFDFDLPEGYSDIIEIKDSEKEYLDMGEMMKWFKKHSEHGPLAFGY